MSGLISAIFDHTRRRIFFCACDIQYDHGCDPEFIWYEPQDIIKGIGIAKKRGLPDGFFVPYKLCSSCRYNRCRSQYV